jgi:hypothetical protein
MLESTRYQGSKLIGKRTGVPPTVAVATIPPVSLTRSAQHRVKLRSSNMLGFVSFNSLLGRPAHSRPCCPCM